VDRLYPYIIYVRIAQAVLHEAMSTARTYGHFVIYQLLFLEPFVYENVCNKNRSMLSPYNIYDSHNFYNSSHSFMK